MNDDQTQNSTQNTSATYSDDDVIADAKALDELADQLEKEADEIEQAVADSSEQIVNDTQEEVAAIEQAARDVDEMDESIDSATGSAPDNPADPAPPANTNQPTNL